MKIRGKIFIFVLSTTFIIFAAVIGFVGYNYQNMAIENAKKLADSHARQSANTAIASLNLDLGAVRGIASTFSRFPELGIVERNDFYKDILRQVLIDNTDFLSTWVSWDLSMLDSAWTSPNGRQRTATLLKNGDVFFYIDTVEQKSFNYEGVYYKTRNTGEEIWMDPYDYVYEAGGDTILESSVGVPIYNKGMFIGLAGVDVTMDHFQAIIDKIIPIKNSYMFMVANNGMIVAHPEKDILRMNIRDVYYDYENDYKLSEIIKKGEDISFTYSEDDNTETYISFVAIRFGKIKTPWSIGIVVPMSAITKNAANTLNISLLVAIFGLFLLSIVIWYISKNISDPLTKVANILTDLSYGRVNKMEKISEKGSYEIGKIFISTNSLIDSLTQMSNFAKKIGEGNLYSKFSPLSSDDVLGNSLIEMRQNLKAAKDTEKKQSEEQKKRHWRQDGITKISEVLRENINNINEFGYSIISNLAQYMRMQQIGLYMINDDDSKNVFIEMIANYASNKRKLLESRIEIGENLIGRCVESKETIFLKEVPEGYLFISSTLGEENPHSILVVPLIYEGEVYGAIELASFRILKEHEIEFTQAIASRMASSLANLKKNTHAYRLLQKSQAQTQVITERDSEMQESMKELRIAQESARRKELETEGIIDAINDIASVVQYKLDGTITSVDDRALRSTKFTRDEILNKNHRIFALEAKNNPKWYDQFWNDLRAGKERKRLLHIKVNGTEFWIDEVYTPIFDSKGIPFKIINIGIDISERKRLAQKINKLIQENSILQDQINKK